MAEYKHLEIATDFQDYVKDKKKSAKAYYRYFLSRLSNMFQYKNLPDTIPHQILDRYLFEYGSACIAKVNGELYVFFGSAGAQPDIYYRPTEFIIANPALNVSRNIKVFNIVGQPITELSDNSDNPSEGVLLRNDSEWLGLHPLIARYSYLLAENVLTLRTADILLRIVALLSAKTDAEAQSAKEYLRSIEKGDLGVIAESAFYEGVEMQSPPSNNGSYLTQFIEYQQYLKGSFYNEIGLSANYNMKREAIGTGESTLDQDTILPLCENMLRCRREDLARVNKLFGTNIEVEFSSAWLENRIQELANLKTLTSSVGQPTGFNNFNFNNPVGQPTGNEAPTNPTNPSNPSNSSPTEADVQLVNSDSDLVEVESLLGQESGKSEINDLSVDTELTEILEALVNQDDVEVNEKGDESDGDLFTPETDSKTEVPED